MNISDAEVASWADQVRRERRATAPWHYVDTPVDADAFDRQRDGRRGANVVDQIDHFETVLADRSAAKEDRAEALKFLVHFVADIHQPLHCAERNGDKGGNSRLVFFLDRQKAVSLHSVWDTWLLRTYIGRTRIAEYAEKLDAQIKAEDAQAWREGTPEQWANESHALAREKVYADVPADGPPPKIDQAYVDDARPVVERQLQRAGLRLASVLTQAMADEIKNPAPASAPATQAASEMTASGKANLFGNDKIRLVVGADDFAEGTITNASVIVNIGWRDETVGILTRQPYVSVGVHVCLDSESVPYKCGPGRFGSRRTLAQQSPDGFGLLGIRQRQAHHRRHSLSKGGIAANCAGYRAALLAHPLFFGQF